MGANPTARLFAELLQALHDESDALVANDAARLAEAGNRREHVLRLLAPQANALRAMRRSGSDEFERFAREAAQLTAVGEGSAMTGLGVSGAAAISARIDALRVTGSD
ncbi:MAG TPA: hypothetical protein PLE54_01540 [Burkholderiaceae bacterium]|nr:hypothetical protein [Burkholderiaceae bacterium]HQR69258.1 hypothetical protein [Burkholderiaceae bacterium]